MWLFATSAAILLPPLTPLAPQPECLAAHYFSDTAQWLVPGRIMLGRYPASCPTRPIPAAAQRERVTSIAAAGVNTFVCLQAELPPQDTAWDDSSQGVVPKGTFVQYGADALANGARTLHFGILDRQPAESLEALDRLVVELRRRVLDGDVLYIHCWGGRGRTGLVAACLLGALYPSIDEAEALERVQAYFSLREPGGLSPETPAQVRQVQDWFYGYRDTV